MPLRTSCSCALCALEEHLLASLLQYNRPFADVTLSMHSGVTSSPADLLRYLKTSPSAAQSDKLLGELVKARPTDQEFAQSLLVLAFVPVLHRTMRQITKRQCSLPEEDVVQQGLRILLQFLASEELQARQSHFAFAISRVLKRKMFAWAAREGRKVAVLDSGGQMTLPFASDVPFERYAQLVHFLNRCVRRGYLSPAELNLVIQFKLEGAYENGFHASNGQVSNAERQKLKRLLAKLRRLAA